MKLISISMEKNHSNPRRYRRSNERAPGKGFTLNTVLAFIVLLCMYQPHALAQELLFDDGNVHKLKALPGGSGTRDGSPLASKIYSNTAYTAVSFTICGGDGGRARADRSSCAEYGGDGAVVKMTVPIGNGTGEIPPGSEIRFFLGKAGEDDYGASASRRYGGGGGGSAVTARFPGKTGSTDWEILAAAGGGAGAEVRFHAINGCVTEKAGQGGRDFNWNRSFDGDGGDPGGGVDGNAGGGGGGAYYAGQGHNVIEGEAGFPDGGRGGQYNSRSRGGWGGGKDNNTFHGGGGGGYTGGNATQGGGSWVNPDYDSNPTLIAGGSTSDTDNGYIEYQFKGICSINSVATTATICGANGSATINVTTACDDNFSYGVCYL